MRCNLFGNCPGAWQSRIVGCVTEAAYRAGRVKAEVLLSLCGGTKVCILVCHKRASLNARWVGRVYLRRMLCNQAPMRCCTHSPALAVMWTGTSSTACLASPRDAPRGLLLPASLPLSSSARVLPTLADHRVSAVEPWTSFTVGKCQSLGGQTGPLCLWTYVCTCCRRLVKTNVVGRVSITSA